MPRAWTGWCPSPWTPAPSTARPPVWPGPSTSPRRPCGPTRAEPFATGKEKRPGGLPPGRFGSGCPFRLAAVAHEVEQETEQVDEVEVEVQRAHVGGHAHGHVVPAQLVVGHLQPLGVVGDQP